MVKLTDGVLLTDKIIKNLLEVGRVIQHDRNFQFTIAFVIGEKLQTGSYSYKDRNTATEDRLKIVTAYEEYARLSYRDVVQ